MKKTPAASLYEDDPVMPGHRRAEVEDRRDEARQIARAQAAAHAEDQRDGGQEEGELHQLRGGVPAEREGHRVEHLHALRQHVVEGDVVGKAAQAQIFAGQPEVVGDAVGDRLRRQRVDEVPDAVRGEDDPNGARNANRIGRSRRRASATQRRWRRRRSRGRRPSAPDGRAARRKTRTLSAGGADREHDFRRRGALAQEEAPSA